MHALSDDDLTFLFMVLGSVPFALCMAAKRYRSNVPPVFPHRAKMRLIMFGYTALVGLSAEGLLEHFGYLAADAEQRLNAILVPIVIFGSIAVLAGWAARARTLGKESVGFLAKLYEPDEAGKDGGEPHS
jgi:hypothetical protein